MVVTMSPQHLGNADLHAEVVRRERASRADAAERLALIAEIDRRRSYEDDGFLSTTSWLKARFRISGAEAKRWVELARRLVELPEVALALAEGDISFDHARLLAAASADHPACSSFGTNSSATEVSEAMNSAQRIKIWNADSVFPSRIRALASARCDCIAR